MAPTAANRTTPGRPPAPSTPPGVDQEHPHDDPYGLAELPASGVLPDATASPWALLVGSTVLAVVVVASRLLGLGPQLARPRAVSRRGRRSCPGPRCPRDR